MTSDQVPDQRSGGEAQRPDRPVRGSRGQPIPHARHPEQGDHRARHAAQDPAGRGSSEHPGCGQVRELGRQADWELGGDGLSKPEATTRKARRCPRRLWASDTDRVGWDSPTIRGPGHRGERDGRRQKETHGRKVVPPRRGLSHPPIGSAPLFHRVPRRRGHVFASDFLQIPPCDGHPCPRPYDLVLPLSVRLSLQRQGMRGTQKNRRARPKGRTLLPTSL